MGRSPLCSRGGQGHIRDESLGFQCLDATPILSSSISKRVTVLISNVSDKEGPESADLPKVMECRWSFRYLEKQTLFYQERGLVS